MWRAVSLLALAACGSHDAAKDVAKDVPGETSRGPADARAEPQHAGVVVEIASSRADGATSLYSIGGRRVPLYDMPRAVLAAWTERGGAAAERARQMLEAIGDRPAELDAAAGPEDPGEIAVSMTYLVPTAQVTPPAPVVHIRHDGWPDTMIEVLDRIGGVIEIDDDVLPLAALWDNPGFGGLEVDADRPSIDVYVGHGCFAIANGGEPRPSRLDDLATSVAPVGTQTIDILVTRGAGLEQVRDVITALAKVATPDHPVGIGFTGEPFLADAAAGSGTGSDTDCPP